MTLARPVEEFVVLALHKPIFWKQVRALAARLPDTGLTPLIPLDELLSVVAFLKRKSAEREG
jgi:hypothetical protein